MPIVFIVIGLYLICFLFKHFQFSFNKVLFLILLLCVELGYFWGDVIFANITINLFHLFVVFLFYCFFVSSVKFKCLLISIIVSLFYFLMIEKVYRFDLVFILFSILPIVLFNGLNDKITYSFITSMSMSIVRVYFEVQTFSLSVVDFDLLFQVFVIFFTFNFLEVYGYFNILGGDYVKKDFHNFNINAFSCFKFSC